MLEQQDIIDLWIEGSSHTQDKVERLLGLALKL